MGQLILIDGQEINGADQFNQMVQQALKRNSPRLVKMVRLDVVKSNIRSFIREWKAENKDLSKVQVNLSDVIMDFSGMIGLTDEETQELLRG